LLLNVLPADVTYKDTFILWRQHPKEGNQDFTDDWPFIGQTSEIGYLIYFNPSQISTYDDELAPESKY